MAGLPIYLDYNATTPCDQEVVDAMLPYFTTHFGNAASRSHVYGIQAEDAVEIAREEVVALAGASDARVIFTSGATESVNLALKGFADVHPDLNILSFATEHRAVLDTLDYLKKRGVPVTLLPVLTDGRIDLDAFQAALTSGILTSGIKLVALMYANNETGVIQPVTEVGRICRDRGIAFFCDATQAIGKIPMNMDDSGVDMLALSAHKIYGPKGAGALIIKRNMQTTPAAQVHGGGHESGMRSGTLNVTGIIGLGRACKVASRLMATDFERLTLLRNRFRTELEKMPGITFNGNPNHLLPHVLHVSFNGPEGMDMLRRLAPYVAASSGSACSALISKPSHVLKAMGMEDRQAMSSIRFSLGRYTSDADIDKALQSIRTIWLKS